MSRQNYGDKLMPKSDNLYYYVVYAIIIVVFFVVLKTPKK